MKKKNKSPKIVFDELGDKRPNGKNKTSFGEIETNSGEIYIDPRQSESELLDTMVHELLHLNFKYMSEKKVHSSASNIANTLWKMGYRRKNKTT